MYVNKEAASDGWRANYTLAYVQNARSQDKKVETGVTRAGATCGYGSWLCEWRVQDTVGSAAKAKEPCLMYWMNHGLHLRVDRRPQEQKGSHRGLILLGHELVGTRQMLQRISQQSLTVSVLASSLRRPRLWCRTRGGRYNSHVQQGQGSEGRRQRLDGVLAAAVDLGQLCLQSLYMPLEV